MCSFSFHVLAFFPITPMQAIEGVEVISRPGKRPDLEVPTVSTTKYSSKVKIYSVLTRAIMDI